MTEIVEYTGQLFGGPDDGNWITASVDVFPVTSVTQLWLDGIGQGKEASVVTIKGVYIWDNDKKYFTWKETSNEISRTKAPVG